LTLCQNLNIVDFISSISVVEDEESSHYSKALLLEMGLLHLGCTGIGGIMTLLLSLFGD
jgi:hypothetical protein